MVMAVKVSVQKEPQPENPYIVRYMGVTDNSDSSQAFLFGGKVMEHLCGCGCGTPVAVNRRFVKGHNKRTLPYITPQGEPNLCECGCGEKVTWNNWKKKWNRFVYCHSKRGISLSEETKLKIGEGNTGKRWTDERKLKIKLDISKRNMLW